MVHELQQVLGNYALVREIARGASAMVYLAEDRRSGARVAIKVALEDPDWNAEESERFRQLFANEAALVGRLVHPNIVRMLEAQVDSEPRWIVMEYVEGTPLRQACQPGQLLPRARVVELLFRCARAMDHVHGCQVLHRDIKPSNILITPDGGIKIIDFGAARIGWAKHTQLGGFLGSPAYMAPEQLEHQTSSRATDVYALGVVLYELLSGVHPFAGDGGPGLVYRIVQGESTPLASLDPTLPPALVQLVHRAIARDPADRYPDAFSLARDLMACGH